MNSTEGLKEALRRVEECRGNQGNALNLSHLKLTELPEDIFSGLSELKRLYLYNNSLTELPEGIFSGLSGLKQLHLNNNSLTELPEKIFSGMSELERLDLDKVDLSLSYFPNKENLKINSIPFSQLSQTVHVLDNDEQVITLHKTHAQAE